jgi:hypothetical protein
VSFVVSKGFRKMDETTKDAKDTKEKENGDRRPLNGCTKTLYPNLAALVAWENFSGFNDFS